MAMSRDLNALRRWARHRTETAPPKERPLWAQIAAEIDRYETDGLTAPTALPEHQQSLFPHDPQEATS